MDFYLAQALTGLTEASSLFLVAAGLSLIFGVTRIVNFAHGAFYMLGAYSAYTLTERWSGQGALGFWGGILAAAAAVALLGAVVEIVLLRRLYGAPELFQLLATFGLTLIVEDLCLLVWGPDDLLGSRAPGLKGAVPILGQMTPTYDLLMIGLGPLVLLLLWILLRGTRFGVLVRAATQDRDMVAALGVNQRWLFTGVFALGVFLAAFAGALQIPRDAVNHTMDLRVIVECFVVVVIGGLGSIGGAFAAALIVAELNAFGILVLPGVSLVLVFVVMALVLLVRPHGLFGRAVGFARSTTAATENRWRPWSLRAWVLAVLGLGFAALLPLRAEDLNLAGLSAALAGYGVGLPDLHLAIPDLRGWLAGLHLPEGWSVPGLHPLLERVSDMHLPSGGLSLPLLGDYGLAVGSEVLIFVLFAASLQLLMSVAGLASFGHAAYFGLGAYGAALAVKDLGIGMAPALAVGTALGLFGALVFGSVCTRLSGVYLAMLTLAVAQVLWSAASQWTPVTGGDNGLLGIWPSAWAASPRAFYWLVLGIAAAGVGLLRMLAFSPFGYALRAARDSPLRADAIGLDRPDLQRAAFMVAGAIAALAGGLFAFLKGSVFPDALGLPVSVDGLVMVLLGGIGTISGSVLGAILYKTLSIWLVAHTDYSKLVLGMVIVLLVVLFPSGIGGLAGQRGRRPKATEVPAAAPVPEPAR